MIARDPHARWIGMGDHCDAILPSDKRYDSRTVDFKRLRAGKGEETDTSDLASEQEEIVDRFFEPIWGKCLGLHKGNHEETLERIYYTNVTRRLCRKHEVPYLGYEALTRLEIASSSESGGKWMVPLTIFSEHGGAGGGTDGNAMNQLQKRGMEFEADLYLKGHVHIKGVSHRTVLKWGPNHFLKQKKVFVLTGTFLRGHAEGETTYAEKKGYRPNEIGSTVVLINPNRRKYGPELQMDAMFTEALEMAVA